MRRNTQSLYRCVHNVSLESELRGTISFHRGQKWAVEFVEPVGMHERGRLVVWVP